MKKFTVAQPTNLRDFTDSTYPQGSFYFSSLIRASDIRVNGVKVCRNVPLKAGDEVVYFTTAKQEQKPSHYKIYEDEKLYVADKFSGVSTEALACETGLIAVHRLDRNTSGAIIFAKDALTAESLFRLFRDRQVGKTYLCLAKNSFKKQCGCLTAYLSKDSKESKVKISDAPLNVGTKIITEYKVLEDFGDYALVEVKLHTGKTHQIRAHLAHIGCPVLGDEKYGDEAMNKKYKVKRQILVSKRLEFRFEGRDYKFESSFAAELPR